MFSKFFLRLVGRDPEQLDVQKRFEDNLKCLDEQGEDLECFFASVKEADQTPEDDPPPPPVEDENRLSCPCIDDY